MSNISYRPDFSYEKNYDTEGSITTESELSQSNETDQLNDIKTLLDRVEYVSKLISYDVSKALAAPIECAKYIYSQIDNDNYDSDYVDSDRTIVYTTPKNTQVATSFSNITVGDTTVPDSILSTSIPIIDVKVVTNDTVEAIEKQYQNTLASILTDYLSNLQTALNKYYSNTGAYAAEAGIIDIGSLTDTYNTKTTSLKDTNLYHVSDLIVRSQIVKDQRIRMINKLFSQEETVSHVKACKIAKDLKIRYYSESKVPNNTYLDLLKNMMLSDSKQIYDKKYKENLFNLYKYLNSSVILIDECLMMFVQESQAKMILKKEGG